MGQLLICFNMGDGLDDLQFICKWVESIRLVLKLIVYLIIFFLLKRGLSEMSFGLIWTPF